MTSDRKARPAKQKSRKGPVLQAERAARRIRTEELGPERGVEIAREIEAKEFRGKPRSI